MTAQERRLLELLFFTRTDRKDSPRRLSAYIRRAFHPGLGSHCWLWKRAKISGGYGALKRRGPTVLVHRLVYQQLVGEVPEGKVLDHLCRERSCCNPVHLEPVTRRENALRGEGTILTDAEVLLACAELEALARKWGITAATFSRLEIRRKQIG